MLNDAWNFRLTSRSSPACRRPAPNGSSFFSCRSRHGYCPPRFTDPSILDNASPDGSGSRVAANFPALAYLQTGENLGDAGGNLRAMEWALAREYDHVLIINDDAEVRPGCVSALLAALAANPK